MAIALSPALVPGLLGRLRAATMEAAKRMWNSAELLRLTPRHGRREAGAGDARLDENCAVWRIPQSRRAYDRRAPCSLTINDRKRSRSRRCRHPRLLCLRGTPGNERGCTSSQAHRNSSPPRHAPLRKQAYIDQIAAARSCCAPTSENPGALCRPAEVRGTSQSSSAGHEARAARV